MSVYETTDETLDESSEGGEVVELLRSGGRAGEAKVPQDVLFFVCDCESS